jgi:hypothetical protein
VGLAVRAAVAAVVGVGLSAGLLQIEFGKHVVPAVLIDTADGVPEHQGPPKDYALKEAGGRDN